MDEVDYKETAILGQNERTGKEQKDRKIPFPGRMGIMDASEKRMKFI